MEVLVGLLIIDVAFTALSIILQVLHMFWSIDEK